MNRNALIIFSFLTIGGLIFGSYHYIQQYLPKYNWEHNYRKSNDQPYGTKLFFNLITESTTEVEVIKYGLQKNLDTNQINSSYIFLGDTYYLNDPQTEHILDYVERGNTCIIISESTPTKILESFISHDDSIYSYDLFWDDKVSVYIDHEELSFHHQNKKDTTSTDWPAYFSDYFYDVFYVAGFDSLGSINNAVNFYGIKHGKGKLLFHTNPILFTNYNISQKKGFQNANYVLSHLNSGKVFWDEASRHLLNSEKRQQGSGNPLQFLFSHKTLRWGWYLFLTTLLIYLIFRTKREQRIIPLTIKKRNSSIEYAKAIGTLYFQKGNHHLIAHEMHLLFMSSVKKKYHIPNDFQEKELIEVLPSKSGVKKKTIEHLFNLFRKVRFSPMAKSKDLIKLQLAVDSFNKNVN